MGKKGRRGKKRVHGFPKAETRGISPVLRYQPGAPTFQREIRVGERILGVTLESAEERMGPSSEQYVWELINHWGEQLPPNLVQGVLKAVPAMLTGPWDVRFSRKIVAATEGEHQIVVHGAGLAVAQKDREGKLVAWFYPPGFSPDGALGDTIREQVRKGAATLQINRYGREQVLRNLFPVVGGYTFEVAERKADATQRIGDMLERDLPPELKKFVAVPRVAGFYRLGIKSVAIPHGQTERQRRVRRVRRAFGRGSLGVLVFKQPRAYDIGRTFSLLQTDEEKLLFFQNLGEWTAGTLATFLYLGKRHNLVHAQPHLGNLLLRGRAGFGRGMASFGLLITDLGEFYDISRHGLRADVVELFSRRVVALTPKEVALMHSIQFFVSSLIRNVVALEAKMGESSLPGRGEGLLLGVRGGLEQYAKFIQLNWDGVDDLIIQLTKGAAEEYRRSIDRDSPMFRRYVEDLAILFCCGDDREVLRRVYKTLKKENQLPSWCTEHKLC